MSEQNFRKALDKILQHPSGDLPDLLKELSQQLRLSAEEEGIPTLAARLKRLLRDQMGSDSLLSAESLLLAFGVAFSGDDVGILGKDIVEPCLHHRNPGIRNAALGCLASWINGGGDDTVLWASLVSAHLSREVDPELAEDCRTLLGDVSEEDIGQEPFDEALGPWAACTQATKNQALASLVSVCVPSFLESCVGLHPSTTIDLIESAKTGIMPTREYHLNIHLTQTEGEPGYVVRVWSSSWACLLQRIEDDRWRVTVGF